MNKADLTDVLASKVEITQHEAKAIINTILESMASALVCGESIQIRGFGNFTVKQYKSYEGRNPKTGEKTLIKPKKLPCFKPGKELKEQVNESRNG
jgi:integration host factor subunit beta